MGLHRWRVAHRSWAGRAGGRFGNRLQAQLVLGLDGRGQVLDASHSEFVVVCRLVLEEELDQEFSYGQRHELVLGDSEDDGGGVQRDVRLRPCVPPVGGAGDVHLHQMKR